MKLLFTNILLLIKLTFLPSVSLLFYMGIAMLVDFATGIAKARVLNQARTSAGYRKTVVKFLQYGGALAVGLILANVGEDKAGVHFNILLSYFNDGLVIFIIYIEVTSVFENLYAIDKKTLLSKYLIAPTLKILTWQIKNNPVAKQAENIKKDAGQTASKL